MDDTQNAVFSKEDLTRFAALVFEKTGVSEEEALVCAAPLVDADLRGCHTHGVNHVIIYARRIREGFMNPRPNIEIHELSPCYTVIDGDNGLGQLVTTRAMEDCIRRAKEYGVAVSLVRHTNHNGMLAYYAKLAAQQDLIGHVMTNAEPWVAPWGGTKPVLSSNPICYAIPAGQMPMIVLDISTSVRSISKIFHALEKGEKIPPEWGFDRHGRPCDDPEEVLRYGSVAPLGSPLLGYKGYGLSLIVDVLCGVLSGGQFSTDVYNYDDPVHPQGVCCYLSVIDPGKVMPIAEFKARVDEDLRRVKASPLAEGAERILIPGELEAEIAARREREGIPLPPDVVATLEETAREFDVLMPNYQRPGHRK